MRVAVALALCACGDDAAHHAADAPAIDAAARPCPASVVPGFGGPPHVVMYGECELYATDVSGALAVASCSDGSVRAGPVNGLLDIQTFDPPGSYVMPRLAPDGRELFVIRGDRFGLEVDAFVPDPSTPNAWHAPVMQVLPAASGLSAPTARLAGAARRLIATTDRGGLQEWTSADATWTQFGAPLATADLAGVTPIGAPSITADGRRVVFAGQRGSGAPAIYYLDRADVARPFAAQAPAKIYDGTGRRPPRTPFMTTDCQTLYFSRSDATTADVAYVDPA